MKRKFLSLLLVICLTLGMLPATALAASVTGCSDNCSHEAAIRDTHYDTLAEAIAVATSDNTIELLAGVTLSESLTISKSITLDGNGNTLTYTGTERAIEMPNVADSDYSVTISDLTVDCTASYCQRGINYNDNGTLTLSNVVVKGENLSYALNLPGLSDGATVAINGGSYTGCIALNVWGANSTITATNAAFTTVDNTAEEGYSVVKLNNNGETSAEGSTITINGGSITVTGTNTTESTVSANNTSTGKIIISDTTEVAGAAATTDVAVVLYEGTDNFYSCTTLQEAIDTAIETNAASVKLIKDITLTESVTVRGTVTLDLNGHTITGTDSNTSGNFYLINNVGTLTVKDSSTEGTGKITLTATTDRAWSSSSVVIANNPGGKLIVESGTIKHLGGTSMAYGIDNLTNGTGTYAETIINGGTIKSTYRAVRQFLNGTEAKNILTINGGTIEGANKSVWMQDPSTKANSGTLTVGEGATLKGNVYLFVTAGSTEWPVAISIANAAFAEGYTVVTGNVPEQYLVENANGTWGVAANPAYGKVAVIDGTYYETLAEAVKVGGTVTLLDHVTLTETVAVSKTVTLDLNGYTVTNTTTTPFVVGQESAAVFTVKDSSAAGTGAIVASENYTNNRDVVCPVVVYYGKFILESGTLSGYECVRGKENKTDEIIIKGGTINAANIGVYARTAKISIEGGTINADYGVTAQGTINISGGTINAEHYGYSSSGNYDNTKVVISGNAEINSKYMGIYWPSGGSLTINGGTITGETGVHFKSGTLSITGGTLIGTGAKQDYHFYDNGSVNTGDALMIENVGLGAGETSGYEAITSVSITGGTFKSTNSYAVSSYDAGVNDAVDAVDDFIFGGKFTSANAEYTITDYVPEDGYAWEGYPEDDDTSAYTWLVGPSYLISINPNGGSFAEGEGYAITTMYGGLLDLSNVNAEMMPSRSGYTFKGWYDAAEGGNQITAETVFTKNATIYAQWTINQYTVTFDAATNGGSCDTANATVTHGGTISALPTASKSGYWYFNGWYTDATGGTQVTTETTFTANTTVYAQFYYSEPYYPTYTPTVTPTVTPSTSTETTENEDGSTTTTVTNNKTGTVTETTENTDGSTTTVETQKDGTVTETVENTDGSTQVTETKSETTTNTDGSTTTTTATKTESTDASGATVTETKTEEKVETETGSVTTSTTEVKTEDKTEVTETTAETTVKEDGTTETVTTSNTTSTDAAGNMTVSTTTATETTTVTDEGATVTEKVEETKTLTEEATTVTTTTSTTTTTEEKTETVAVTEETVAKADGTTETTTTTTTEIALADGTTGTAVTDESGKTEAEVVISEEAAASEEPVALPIPAVNASTESEAASTVTVTTNSEEATSVEIPVADVSAGTVAVIVNEDGTETVIQETKMTDNGLVIDVPDGATVKIVDNSTDFDDVEDHHWENEAVDFASARGLIKGVGNNTFDSDGTATRGQIVTLLARLAGVDTEPGEGEKWYDKGHEWAVENGITYEGNLDAAVSRQSMFTMMWRMLGCPESDHDISDFTDTDGLTQHTEEAARWAVEIGLMQGYGDGTMNPTGSVTRGELTQFLMNFIQLT